MTNDPHRRAELLWASGFVAIAGLLRAIGLGTWSFWEDEIFTLRDAASFPGSLTINPLPYAAVAACLRLFGEHEWSARLAPAIVGTATVPLVQWAGNRLLGNGTGRFAALFVALSPWHLFWSQNARHYVFTAFFAVLAVVALHRLIETSRLRWLIVAWASFVATVLSHTLAVALGFGLAAYTGYLTYRSRRSAEDRTALRYAAVFLAPLVLLGLGVLVLPQARTFLFSGWGHNLWARSPAYVLMTFLHGVTLPVAVCALAGALLPGEPRHRARALVVCGAIFPVGFFVAASLAQNVTGYYAFFAMPFVCLLAGSACARASSVKGTGLVRWLAPAAVVAALLAGDALYYTAEAGGRPDWRGAMREALPLMEPGDLVLSDLPEVAGYYARDARVAWQKLTLEAIRKPDGLPSPPPGRSAFIVTEVRALESLDPSGAFRAWLGSNADHSVHRAGYARASDRSIDVYRLRYSRNTESP